MARVHIASTRVLEATNRPLKDGAPGGDMPNMTSTIQTIHAQGWILISVLAVAVSFFAFVAWWALVGWGVSIAMRAYRWGMRGHARKHWTPEFAEDAFPGRPHAMATRER